MRVTVLLFSSYAEALGKSKLDLDMPSGARAGDLLSQVRQMAGERALPPALIAVNQSYENADYVVQLGDEVAIIPPVAGG